VSDNYTSIERPPEHCRRPRSSTWSPISTINPLPSTTVPSTPERSLSSVPRTTYTILSWAREMSATEEWTRRGVLCPGMWCGGRGGKGKRRPCRKSLYVPRVNGFFSDGVNSRVPTTRRWGRCGHGGHGRKILIPGFFGVNVLSDFFFMYFRRQSLCVSRQRRFNGKPEDQTNNPNLDYFLTIFVEVSLSFAMQLLLSASEILKNITLFSSRDLWRYIFFAQLIPRKRYEFILYYCLKG